MSRVRRSHCRDCGASGNDVLISKTGLCPPCSDRRMLDNVRAMQTRQGPTYARWLESSAAQLAARIAVELDDDTSSS